MNKNKDGYVPVRISEDIIKKMMIRKVQLGFSTISEYVRSLIYEDLDIDPKKSNNKENEREVN